MSNLLNTKGGPRGTRQKNLQNLDSIMRLQDKRKGPRAFRCADVKVSPFIRIGEDLKPSALPRGVHLFRDTYGIIAITNRTKEFVGGVSR